MAGKAKAALDVDKMVKLLNSERTAVVAQVTRLAENQLQVEERRATLLDAKGTALLGQAALSTTIAFTFGGLILQNIQGIKGHLWAGRYILLAFYPVSIFFGLLTTLAAVWALFVRQYRDIDPNEVFNDKKLVEEKEEGTIEKYNKYIAVHLWLVVMNNIQQNDIKAGRLRAAQVLYGVFIVAIGVISGVLTLALGRSLF